MTLNALVRKEVHDLVRERRFGAWALVYTLVWAVILVFVMIENRTRYGMGGGGAMVDHVSGPSEMMYFITVIALGVLALFVSTDGVCREREEGTLPLVAATPAARAEILVAKLAAAGVAYVASFLVALLAISPFVAMYGGAMATTLALYFAVPLLAFYVFVVGMGTLLSVLASSSKVAIGSAFAIYFPLFFLNPYMNIERLFADTPWVPLAASFTPFYATQVAANVLLQGGQLPWPGLLATAGAGVACALAAFIVFSRQEAVQ